MCPPHGCLLRSDERAVRADLPDLLCMCTFSGFVFSPFFLFSALTGFSCSCGRSGSPRPHGDSWGRRSCREKHVVQCRARLRVGRGGERDRGREGHQDRDWVCSELFLWLQPKIRLDAAGCGEAEIAQSSGKGLGCHHDATCPVRHGDCHLSLSGEATRPHGTGQSCPGPAPR